LQLWEVDMIDFSSVKALLVVSWPKYSQNHPQNKQSMGMHLAHCRAVVTKSGQSVAITRKLRDLFDGAQIPYEVYNHPIALSGQEKGSSRCAGGRNIEVVMLTVDKTLAMSVVPKKQRIHLPTACVSLCSQDTRLANESDLGAYLPRCEIAALPPFGNLFGLPVYLDPAVARHENIFFSAGNLTQTVRISYRDYERLVRPRIVRLTDENWAAA